MRSLNQTQQLYHPHADPGEEGERGGAREREGGREGDRGGREEEKEVKREQIKYSSTF